MLRPFWSIAALVIHHLSVSPSPTSMRVLRVVCLAWDSGDEAYGPEALRMRGSSYEGLVYFVTQLYGREAPRMRGFSYEGLVYVVTQLYGREAPRTIGSSYVLV